MKNITLILGLIFLSLSNFAQSSMNASQKCKQDLDGINDKIRKRNADYEDDKQDLKNGYFCSKCHKSKSYFEREHQDFFEHVRNVQGQVVSANAEDWNDLNSSYQNDYKNLKEEYDNRQKDCNEQIALENKENAEAAAEKRKEEDEKRKADEAEREQKTKDIAQKNREEYEKREKEKADAIAKQIQEIKDEQEKIHQQQQEQFAENNRQLQADFAKSAQDNQNKVAQIENQGQQYQQEYGSIHETTTEVQNNNYQATENASAIANSHVNDDLSMDNLDLSQPQKKQDEVGDFYENGLNKIKNFLSDDAKDIIAKSQQIVQLDDDVVNGEISQSTANNFLNATVKNSDINRSEEQDVKEIYSFKAKTERQLNAITQSFDDSTDEQKGYDDLDKVTTYKIDDNYSTQYLTTKATDYLKAKAKKLAPFAILLIL